MFKVSEIKQKGKSVYIYIDRNRMPAGEIRLTKRDADLLYDAICLYDAERAKGKWKERARDVARKKKG